MTLTWPFLPGHPMRVPIPTVTSPWWSTCVTLPMATELCILTWGIWSHLFLDLKKPSWHGAGASYVNRYCDRVVAQWLMLQSLQSHVRRRFQFDCTRVKCIRTACSQVESGTSCYHLVTRLLRPTDWRQVVPTSPISSVDSVRNKLITTSSWQIVTTSYISLVGRTCSKSLT
jgi:hypothetical protein